MPESVKRRGSSGPTIGAMLGLSCLGSVAMCATGYGGAACHTPGCLPAVCEPDRQVAILLCAPDGGGERVRVPRTHRTARAAAGAVRGPRARGGRGGATLGEAVGEVQDRPLAPGFSETRFLL